MKSHGKWRWKQFGMVKFLPDIVEILYCNRFNSVES